MQMVLNEKNDEMKDILVHHLYGAMQLKEHIQQGHQWLEKGYVFPPNDKENKLVTLNEMDKQSLMLSICKSDAFTLKERNLMVE